MLDFYGISIATTSHATDMKICILPGKKSQNFHRRFNLEIDIVRCDPSETCLATGGYIFPGFLYLGYVLDIIVYDNHGFAIIKSLSQYRICHSNPVTPNKYEDYDPYPGWKKLPRK